MSEEPLSEWSLSEEALSEEALSEEALSEGPATTGWSGPALVLGAAIVAIAVSGLLDDSGLAEHPYWVVPAACLFAACATVAARTVRRVLAT